MLPLLALAITAGLIVSPPPSAAPEDLVSEISGVLSDSGRLRRVRVRREGGAEIVQIDLGSSRVPSEVLGDDLREIVQRHLGPDAGVRLTYRFESYLR